MGRKITWALSVFSGREVIPKFFKTEISDQTNLNEPMCIENVQVLAKSYKLHTWNESPEILFNGKPA